MQNTGSVYSSFTIGETPMKKLVVFTGESGSGKTTLIARLTERYPERFRKVVTCTSRPLRTEEVNGIDYHFLPAEYFIENNKLVLVNKTNDGFYYGTRMSDLCSDSHHKLLTLRLVGVRRLVQLGLNNIVLVRISISDQLKVKRMQERGDTAEMIFSRLRSDSESRTTGHSDLGKTLIIDLCATHTVDENMTLFLNACW
ncbi:MAG: hypothetical protein KA054_00020 [Candidatus Moranbacteria bacterium]|nr:hypothetical protein [Candidatus Moranbacteria bacterium]